MLNDNKNKIAFRFLLLATVMILAIGTVFFHEIEGWSWLDAYYYCVVTLTTVGYGDLVPQTELGRFAATIYILLGVGIIAGFIQTAIHRRGSEMIQKRAKDKIDGPKKVSKS